MHAIINIHIHQFTPLKVRVTIETVEKVDACFMDATLNFRIVKWKSSNTTSYLQTWVLNENIFDIVFDILCFGPLPG